MYFGGNKRRTKAPRRYSWNNPIPSGVCDGCGFVYNKPELREQMEYRGGLSPIGTGILVCGMCYNTPNAQYRFQYYPPDPETVPFARPFPPITFFLTTENDIILATEDGILLEW